MRIIRLAVIMALAAAKPALAQDRDQTRQQDRVRDPTTHEPGAAPDQDRLRTRDQDHLKTGAATEAALVKETGSAEQARAQEQARAKEQTRSQEQARARSGGGEGTGDQVRAREQSQERSRERAQERSRDRVHATGQGGGGSDYRGGK